MDDEPVTPIKPELAVKGSGAQVLLDKMVRRYCQFAAVHGEPTAFALVLMDQAGTTECFFQTLGFDGADIPARGGWRGFLALAGARLTALSLVDDND